MTESYSRSASQIPILRQVARPGRAALADLPSPFSLDKPITVVIGRDPRCQIVLSSQVYGGVSRQHAQLSPAPHAPSGWQICDLNSANGTYVNGFRVQGCQTLNWGDRITLAQDGPQFVFELQPVYDAASPPVAPVSPPYNPNLSPASFAITEHPLEPNSKSPPQTDAVTFSQLFPIVSTGRDLTRKAYLVPGIVTVIFVVLMFVTNGNPTAFNFLLAAYISGAAYYLFINFAVSGSRGGCCWCQGL